MKHIRYYAALMLAFLLVPMVALASDISGALFFGNIVISNNGTATTNVTSNFTGLNADNLIADGFMNATANNSVIRNVSGADVIFQVGFNGAPWMLFVPAIGQDVFLTNILYAAESSGGSQAYFPDANGMTIADNASLEPGDNFTLEIDGYIDTLDVDGILLEKPDALTTFISAPGDISVSFGATVLDVGPGANDLPGVSTGGVTLIDAGNPANLTGRLTSVEFWTNITITDMQVGTFFNTGGNDYKCRDSQAVGVLVNGAKRTEAVDLEIEAGDLLGIYFTVGQIDADGGAGAGRWNLAGDHITPGDVETYALAANSKDAIEGFGEVQVPVITATNIVSAEQSIKTSANTTHIAISVNDVLKDSAVLGAPITSNSANWTIGSLTTPYIKQYKHTVGGTLRSDLEWQYSANFTDSSGNGNDGIPSFAVDSADPDITASIQSFQPVSEAKAPDFSLDDSIPFIEGTGNMTGNFTTGPTIPGTGFPLAGVIAAVAGATTPPQLPLMMIAVFVILTFSLAYSGVTRRFGSGSIFGKAFVIIAVMSIFAALGNFGVDFWMIVTFSILVTALAMASRQQSWQ